MPRNATVARPTLRLIPRASRAPAELSDVTFDWCAIADHPSRESAPAPCLIVAGIAVCLDCIERAAGDLFADRAGMHNEGDCPPCRAPHA